MGLKLGLSAKQAILALQAKYPAIAKPDFMPGQAQFTPGKQYRDAVVIHTDRFKLFLQFTETYPFQPDKPEQLTSIDYTPITATEADLRQFHDAVLAKYGEPYRETRGVSALWCNKGTSLGYGVVSCAPDLPTLQLKGIELILFDNGPVTRERAAWNRRTTSTAPPL